MEHSFTNEIREILVNYFENESEEIFEKSLLIQYINEKTRSVNKNSKARSSFANLYAIYVILEDYLNNNFDKIGDYSFYEGAPFSKLMIRQRELPFGSKLQNHALNNRMNSEFQKYFPNSEYLPIIRNLETNRYWINENLLKIKIKKNIHNIAKPVIDIINTYIRFKQDAFSKFVNTCIELKNLNKDSFDEIKDFILSLISTDTDARLFEIVSYSILKYYYYDQVIYWGFSADNLTKENLKLFKTGRTNANDGGIDFVMKPLGRFFQVTETLDFKKYFLDIEKIQKYPITFVVKSIDQVPDLLDRIRTNAIKTYQINTVVEKYMDCIEEIINIPKLMEKFHNTIELNYLKNILDEIILQSKIEFNYEV